LLAIAKAAPAQQAEVASQYNLALDPVDVGQPDVERAVTPKEYWAARAAADERERIATRDFKAIRKAWNASGAGGRAKFREWIAARR
jgi:hypothetical protein